MKEQVFYCVICKKQIDDERVIRKSVTCSDEHAKELKNRRRRVRDLTRCRNCNRPSTPEERKSYSAWRRTLPESKRGRKKGQKNKPKPPKPEQLTLANEITIN
jgi:hypothetical protein